MKRENGLNLDKEFNEFQFENTAKDNAHVNKELLLMRNKIYTVITAYEKYTQKLKGEV